MRMVYILPGTRFATIFRNPHENNFGLIFPGNSSYGPYIPSFTFPAAMKVPTGTKTKQYSFSMLPHANGICNSSGKFIEFRMPREKNATSLENQVQSSPSLHYLKLLLMCGFFTLQITQQALAGADATSNLQTFSFIGDLGDINTGFASAPQLREMSSYPEIRMFFLGVTMVSGTIFGSTNLWDSCIAIPPDGPEIRAFLLIFFSELGDKTFFIAALLAARNSAAVTFVGTFGALAVMTIISVVLGRTFHYVDDILPFRFGNTDLPIDDLAAVCLLLYFGISSLVDASSGDGLKAEEEQKEAELAVSEVSGSGAGILAAANTVVSTFLLVFVAEWGDKSFFSTIALAAASSPLGVVAGALAGHAFATLLAVVGGSFLGTFLSEKAIAYIGGSLFLLFASVTLIEIVSR